MSAVRSSDSRLLWPSLICTRPMLTLIAKGRPLQTKRRSCTDLRRASAIRSLACAGQFSRMMPNSSPPRRARVSPSRRWCCSSPQTWRSSSSPAAWPLVSLTSLNWSRSRNISAWRRCSCCRRSSSWARRYSNSRRLTRPVSASWLACQDRLATNCRSRVMSCSTITAPLTRPSLRIGVPTRLTATALPSGRTISLLWSQMLRLLPASSACSSGSPAAPGCSSTIENSASKAWPRACSTRQPVSCSAVGFM
ncbi:hypothetical protein D3C78_1284550 [compost metagenome]